MFMHHVNEILSIQLSRLTFASLTSNFPFLQFDRMKISVKLAGGTPLLLESKPRSLAQLTADNAIFMYCDPKTQPAWYKDCSTYLTR